MNAKTLSNRVDRIHEDLELCRELVKSWEEYLVWDLENPWDGKTIRIVPSHYTPDDMNRKLERPGADTRAVYEAYIKKFKAHILQAERALAEHVAELNALQEALA